MQDIVAFMDDQFDIKCAISYTVEGRLADTLLFCEIARCYTFFYILAVFSVDFSPTDYFFDDFYLFHLLTFLCRVALFIYIFHKMLFIVILRLCERNINISSTIVLC